ncbi:hypothetical protein EW146_g3700 [Bondarzewia mesenterica]|uniref:Uncharacterized protein n=1 Tax=Bondarzewia mesenterica TaxID=1095465 RepID=A0A4S4LWS8_9AGAM|nr:hypothetical protein EW146_g3700 [Bondarzewia mesenterica]
MSTATALRDLHRNGYPDRVERGDVNCFERRIPRGTCQRDFLFLALMPYPTSTRGKPEADSRICGEDNPSTWHVRPPLSRIHWPAFRSEPASSSRDYIACLLADATLRGILICTFMEQAWSPAFVHASGTASAEYSGIVRYSANLATEIPTSSEGVAWRGVVWYTGTLTLLLRARSVFTGPLQSARRSSWFLRFDFGQGLARITQNELTDAQPAWFERIELDEGTYPGTREDVEDPRVLHANIDPHGLAFDSQDGGGGGSSRSAAVRDLGKDTLSVVEKNPKL